MTRRARLIKNVLIVICVVVFAFFLDAIVPGSLDDACQRSEELC
jgi:hypothetical protein